MSRTGTARGGFSQNQTMGTQGIIPPTQGEGAWGRQPLCRFLDVGLRLGWAGGVMKTIDVKSLLIGIPPASTLFLGIAATSPTDKWDPNQWKEVG